MPNTLDWRPLLPWAGVVFFGLGAARRPGVMAWLTSPERWRAASAPWRALSFAGRHSLPIYLVHQPILIGIVYALTAWGGLAPKPDDSAFLAECQRACVAKGRAGRRLRDLLPMRRRRRRALGRGRPAGDAGRREPGSAPDPRRRLHGAMKRGAGSPAAWRGDMVANSAFPVACGAPISTPSPRL